MPPKNSQPVPIVNLHVQGNRRFIIDKNGRGDPAGFAAHGRIVPTGRYVVKELSLHYKMSLKEDFGSNAR
jgi:hypothetical protein